MAAMLPAMVTALMVSASASDPTTPPSSGSLSSIVGDIGVVVKGLFGWMGELGDMVTSTPFFAVFFYLGIAGIAIGLLTMLARRH